MIVWGSLWTPPSESGVWLLALGFWNDAGDWLDGDSWID